MRAKMVCHLRGGLAGGEDDLGHAGAQRAVVVELGEAAVSSKGRSFRRSMRIGDRDAALAHFVEQSFDQCAVHQRFSFVGA